MKWTYEDLKSFAAARCVDLYRAVKPQDMASLPEEAQALWKLGWEMSSQFDTYNIPICVNEANDQAHFAEVSDRERRIK
jgi:hypothetical protein